MPAERAGLVPLVTTTVVAAASARMQAVAVVVVQVVLVASAQMAVTELRHLAQATTA